MPPLPRAAGRAGSRFQGIVELDDLLDERGLGVQPGVGGEQTGRVGEQDQQIGAHEVRHECGETVVVAEADLVVGDGVVLVDDRDDAELQQSFERGSGVQATTAVTLLALAAMAFTNTVWASVRSVTAEVEKQQGATPTTPASIEALALQIKDLQKQLALLQGTPHIIAAGTAAFERQDPVELDNATSVACQTRC